MVIGIKEQVLRNAANINHLGEKIDSVQEIIEKLNERLKALEQKMKEMGDDGK